MRLGWAIGAWLSALALTGCTCGRDEGLVVTVQTDFVAVAEFDFVRVTLDAGRARDVDVAVGQSFARPQLVATYPEATSGLRTVVVSLIRAGSEVVSRRVQVAVESGYLLNVILSRRCGGVRCGATQTCVGGTCADPSCVTGLEASCPVPQCDAVRACTSTTVCVRPTCIASLCLESADDTRCPGTDICVPGAGCVPRPIDSDSGLDRDVGAIPDGGGSDAPMGCTAPSDCDDGVACTADTCSADRVCIYTPDDARCPTSACEPLDGTADRATGCLPPCDATTCVSSGCEIATCASGRCERRSTCAMGETCCGAVCALDCGALACAGRPAGAECRAAAGPCDRPEVCDGTSPECPPDALYDETRSCRPATDPCDVAETCTTGTPACPVDVFAPTGAGCPGGTCNGLGGCSTSCTPGAPCATANPCEVGVWECSPGPACVPAGPAPAETVCRGIAGPCDAAETCGGRTTCPPDGFRSGFECRSQRGVCDIADDCDGTGPFCPVDQKQPASSVCRLAAPGGCDVAELCTGFSDDCPPNAVAPAGTTCRVSGGPCDQAEVCNGVGAACPSDDLVPAGTTCRAMRGPCDAVETCSGLDPRCPFDGLLSGVSCRAAAGACDGEELCNGSSPDCPFDELRPSGATCRPAFGACDVTEFCDGSSPTCPPDAFSTGSLCRSSFGDCDAPELCDGSARDCPPNGFSPAGTTCRAAAGECDVAESCSGSSASCPPDAFAMGPLCRPAGDPCNPGEFCDGSGPSCPPDYVDPDGSPCDLNCGQDEYCSVGSCVGGAICPVPTFCDSDRCCVSFIGEICPF